MKTFIFLFCFLMTAVFGQDHYLGINGGYTYSSANILSGTSGEMEPQHFYFGEFNYQYHPEKWFFFNIGIRYDRKGFGINDEAVLINSGDMISNSDSIGNYSYDFHKVGVPLKLGFKLGGKVYFHLAAGLIPSYSILSDASWNLNYQGVEFENQSIGNWTNIKNFELAWLGEIGIGARLGENILLDFTAGYSQSLTKHLLPTRSIENGSLIDYSRTMRFKGIHGAIGLYFRLHKPKKKMQKYSPSSN